MGQMLHKFVWEVKQMPSSEYMDWIEYFNEQERKQEVKGGNLMAMNKDELTKAFPGGD